MSQAERAEQLQRRLRFLAIGTGVLIVPLVVVARAMGSFASVYDLFLEPPWFGYPLVWAFIALVAGLTVLSPHRSPSVGTLRATELAFIGTGCLIYTLGSVAAGLQMPVAVIATVTPLGAALGSMAGSVFWVSVMIAYGVYVPNTWRRCAAAMVVATLLATVPDAIVLGTRGAPTGAFVAYLAVRLFWLIDAGMLGIFGSYRINALQRDAAEAKQLGQYIIRERIGAGGMGEVYLAEHQLLRRPCALKLIRPGAGADADALARFEREVHATAGLTHPNTVQVFDYGRADDGTFFYVMEYLPGMSLEQLVESKGRLAVPRAVHFLVQVCGALQEAHTKGLVHRDIKPSNVMICERGGVQDVAKLLDFGVAAALHAQTADPKLTQAGVILGTPAFMSPEQAAGDGELTSASDIYSVGALAYYLFTGKVPFAGRSATQMLAAHMYERPAFFTRARRVRSTRSRGRGIPVPGKGAGEAVRECHGGGWGVQWSGEWLTPLPRSGRHPISFRRVSSSSPAGGRPSDFRR